MFFKKKPATNNAARRRPQGQSRGSTVFSYHASRSARTGATARNTADAQPWGTSEKPVASRRQPTSGWKKRAPALAVVIVIAVLAVNSLLVGNDPEIIPLADKQQQRVFLRSAATYQQAAQDILASSVFNTNKLTIDTTRIAETFKKRFPELEEVSLTLPVTGHRPTLYIQPALPALLIKTANGGVYILDTAGRAMINASETTRIDRLALPVVEDQTGLPVSLGKGVLPSNDVAFIREVVGQLEAKKLSITGVVLPKGSGEVDVRIEGVPYIVKFNLRGDARAEAGAYLAVKKYLDREHKTPGTYVDVRLDNKAYYR
jgi:hypothetical protein